MTFKLPSQLLLWRVALSVFAVSLAAAALVAPPKSKIPQHLPSQTDSRLPVPLDEVVVTLKSTVNKTNFAEGYGLKVVRPMRSKPNAWIFKGLSPQYIEDLMPLITGHSGVESAFQNQRIKMDKSFAPDDPYFRFNSPAGYAGQWHLVNTHNLGGEWIDANVKPAWDRDVTGLGVVIGIVDDSLDRNHEDIRPNYVSRYSWDFGNNDSDPSPYYEGNDVDGDNHGTAVGGVAAGAGGNGIGITGAAPIADLAGLRIDLRAGTVAQVVDAVLYNSSGSNTNIAIKNHSYGIGLPFIPNPDEASAVRESTGDGTIHVYAAANNRTLDATTDRGIARDSNLIDVQNEASVITVAALGMDGKFADYSNYGACVFVTAPSGSSGLPGITTTDTSGSTGYTPFFPDQDYTHVFGGTSSAAPLVSGVLALVKEVQPNLDTRLAKHLIARTSYIVDPSDDSEESDFGWLENAAGFSFNQSYGFGLINAGGLVAEAPKYQVTDQETETESTTTVNEIIPDEGYLDESFFISSETPLEEVEITLDIDHPYNADLEAYLISPSGTYSRLFKGEGFGYDMGRWRFTSNAFWGENPRGRWYIEVYDIYAGDLGRWNSFSARMRMGEMIPVPAPTVESVSISPTSIKGGREATGRVVLTGPTNQDLNVSLSSNLSSATVPSSVLVPLGSSSVEFSVTTTAVQSDTSATITAATGSVERTASLAILAPDLTGLTMNPVQVNPGGSSTGTVTIDSPAPTGGLAIALASSLSTVTVPSSVTVAAGSTTATFTASASSSAGAGSATITASLGGDSLTATLEIQSARLNAITINPAMVMGGENATATVSLTGSAPTGGLAVSLRSNRASASVPATVTVPGGQSSATFTVTTTKVGAISYPQIYATLGAVTRFVQLTVQPPRLTAFTIIPSVINFGQSSTATITIAEAAPAGGVAVALRSAHPTVATVAASATIPEGATSTTVAVNSQKVNMIRAATLVATVGRISRSANVVVYPPVLSGMTISPSTVIGGQSATATVTLETTAPAGGIVVSLRSSRSEARVPASVTIPGGATSAAFTVTTSNPAARMNAQIYATIAGRTRFVTLGIIPSSGG